LECEEGFSLEKVSYRYFHLCKANGEWAKIENVIVQCLKNMMLDQIEQMAEKVEENLVLSHDMNEKMLKLTEDGAVIIEDQSLFTNKTETSKKLLVLSTKPFQAVPFTFGLNGHVQSKIDFKFPDLTAVFLGCATVFENKMLYFGGVGNNNKQLSQVEDCSLKRIGELDFEFENGACNTFDRNDKEEVFLCFSSTDAQVCKIYNGSVTTDGPTSNNPHASTQLGNYSKQPLAVGNFQSSTAVSANVELLKLGEDKWTDDSIENYPYGNYIASYSMVSTENSVIVIGGYSDAENSNIIARFADNVWSNVGELVQARLGHASILINNEIYVLGGGVAPQTYAFTEKCTFNENDINCAKMNPGLLSRVYQLGIAIYEDDNCPPQ